MTFEITAEDEAGRRIAEKTRKWSDRKKKFITRDESKDVFGKLMVNESGQKVNKNYVPGQLYAQWRSKSGHINAVGEGASSSEFHGNHNRFKDKSSNSNSGNQRPVKDTLISVEQATRNELAARKLNERNHSKQSNKKPGFKGGGRKK